MSQSFKFIYDDLKENDSTEKDESSKALPKAFEEFYADEGHTRNICFVWLDSKRIFMNYSYLISGEYSPEQSTITLSFTSCKFVLTGVNLENLFYDIMHHLVKQVTCTDTRYNLIGDNEKFFVNEISISNVD